MDRSRRGRSVDFNGSGDDAGSFRIIVLVVVLTLLAAVGAGIIFIIKPGSGAIPTPSGMNSPAEENNLDSNTFYNGVFVDDISLGGLTLDQAKQQVEAKQKALVDSTAVTVTKDDKSWQFKASAAKYQFDTNAILEQAWQQGRQGTNVERLAFIKQLPQNPVKLKTTITADPSALEQQVRDLATPYAVAPVNAAYSGYDLSKPDGSRLAFSSDKQGSKVDGDALWAAVEKEFKSGTFGTVAMQTVPVQADVTQADLQAMKLVDRFTSVMKDHSLARYTNIKTACAAVTGHILLPGEVFSFNDTTGMRTAEKGYMEAHIINGGVVDNGMAGGTCQVSGTLWNTVARADLEIVERQAHTLKSSYLPMGQDATVDYGHYDLKFKNNKDKPILIIMYIGTGKDKNTVFGEVYGEPLPNGETIDLLTEKTATVPAPNTISYAQSEAVKPGTTETVKPHDGIKCTTYKIYMKGGQEVDRKVLHKDYYREAGTIICYNPADGKPTPAPSATATPQSGQPARTSTPEPSVDPSETTTTYG